MRAAGFELVGDLACSRFGDIIIRGYAREDGRGDTWAVYLAGVLESRFELVTELVSGAWLSTGLREAEDDVEKRLYRVGCPDLNFRKLGKLFGRHDARRGELALGHGVTTPLDLVALARAIDRSLCRQLGLQP